MFQKKHLAITNYSNSSSKNKRAKRKYLLSAFDASNNKFNFLLLTNTNIKCCTVLERVLNLRK